MLQLRDYQRASLDALYAYWAIGGGNGLIVLPTGAGKALVIAKLIEELLRDYPEMRILNVTHSASLVEQNFKEFIGLNPFAPAGIYSASLGRRDLHSQVLFCGIQSVASRAADLGVVDLVIVDEAHAISRNSDTLYGKFFKAIKEGNPDSRVAGTTATDYRMDSGRLTEGDDRLFDDVVYEIGIAELMEQGYLTRLTSQKTTAKINLAGIGTRGGEYIPGQVADAAEAIIEAAIAEDMVLSHGRKAGLFFSTSKENAAHIAHVVEAHGRKCAVLTSDNAHEIRRIFEDFRAGRIWAISSVAMITTGTNFPFVDFISLILSTKSAGKLVQILGRGTRNSPGKTDCLIADHGKNLSFHGPIDQIRPREPGSGGEQPKKLCPTDQTDVNGQSGCDELLPISVMVCHCCGYVFPPSEEEKITAAADSTPVLSSERPWYEVTGRRYAPHPGKVDKPPTVKATYEADGRKINEWLCPQHTGFAKNKADRYWMLHSGSMPYPASVNEFLERAGELRATTEIQLDFSRNPKYPDVKAFRVGDAVYATETTKGGNLSGRGLVANDNRPAAANDNAERARLRAMMDDDIPF